MTKDLKTYIDNWRKIEEIKPKNEPTFIEMFIEFLNGVDDERDISFDGDGSYFGKQITVIQNWPYGSDRGYGFEISYCSKIISVYTAAHDGYWTPEFIKLEIGEPYFDELKKALHDTMYKLFGLGELQSTNLLATAKG